MESHQTLLVIFSSERLEIIEASLEWLSPREQQRDSQMADSTPILPGSMEGVGGEAGFKILDHTSSALSML